MSKKLTTEIFIERANMVHNYKYLYHKSDYISSTEKIVITCKIHGDFSQTSGSHLQGTGCRKCHIEAKNKSSYKEQKVLFINKAKLKYGDYYDYSLFEYGGIDNNSIFICPIHGKFYQTPYRHLRSKIGCFKCAVNHTANKNRKLPIELAKLKKNCKRRIKTFMNGRGIRKRKEVESILGLNWNLFKDFLENNIYGFRIGDKNLDLDHITPLSSAITEEDFIRLNHYTNFQLLPRVYNQQIKRDKIFNIEDFEKWLKTNYNG